MNSISKEKRSQLILVVLVTVGLAAGLWFGLIQSQNTRLRSLASRKSAAEHTLQQVRQVIENADEIEGRLAEASAELNRIEETMASGDLYSWEINTLRQFKQPYKVEIPQFSQIDGPKEMNMLPKFPYRHATMMVSGIASFHDFGKFIADFENQFPYMRVLNLNLEPVPAIVSSEREKLSFKMEIATLVKPTSS